MDIKILESGTPLQIMLIGKIFREDDFRKLNNIIAQCIKDKNTDIIFDLSRLSFISSQALGVFVKAYRILLESNGRLRLYNPRREVKEVIEISGISRIIPVCESEEDF